MQDNIKERAVIKPSDSIAFLKQIWDYENNNYYSIVVLGDTIEYRHFTNDFQAIREYLENIKY
ncbi:MAG: hypothetical protein QXL14_03535, partial [Candidatus Aenigmatarchaeota archaeon]